MSTGVDVRFNQRRLELDRDEELRANVELACDLLARRSPYFSDAVAYLVEAWRRHPISRRQQRDAENARLVQLLRDTDPAKLQRRAA